MGANVTSGPRVASLPSLPPSSEEAAEVRRLYRAAATPAEKLEVVKEIQHKAREHGRLAEAHKRRQRILMDQFAQFRTDLESLGIQVVIEKPKATDAKGGKSD